METAELFALPQVASLARLPILCLACVNVHFALLIFLRLLSIPVVLWMFPKDSINKIHRTWCIKGKTHFEHLLS